MRATSLFFFYLLLCFVLAALATYPLVTSGWIELEPQRVMGRLTQAFAVCGIWPFLRALKLADRTTLGYGPARAILIRTAAQGWVLGVAILLVLVWILLVLEVRQPSEHLDPLFRLLARVTQAIIGGLLIALLEETFFRGALYTAIRRRGGMAAALLWSSGLYAILHFMKPGALPAGVSFDAAGCLSMFMHVFMDIAQWKNVDSLVALFLVGMLLALVRERTGHIGWCIGLHAGWVFVIQITRRLTDGNAASEFAFLAGAYDGTIGWLAAAWIGLLLLTYWVFTRRFMR
jgi:uncharacterized protein